MKFEVKNRDKIFWPDEGYTKGDLIDYYDSVADTLLPHLKGRPESMNRFPDGINGPSFFHKDLESAPSWIKTKAIYSDSNDADINWLIADDRDSLLYMANLGCIELNPWHSRVGKLEHPDYCLIDLDAKTNDFPDVVKVATEFKKYLDELKIPGYAKTSGKTGIHICIPFGAKYNYDQSRQFAQLLVTHFQPRLADLTSVDRSPGKREHKIYLDYLQNRHGQTMAAPYCVRPVPGATVSTPLDWSEVKRGLDPKKFTIKNTAQRLAKIGDLWKPVLGKGIDMKAVLEKLA